MMVNNLSILDLALYIYLRSEEKGKDPVEIAERIIEQLSINNRLNELKQALLIISRYSIDIHLKEYIYESFKGTKIHRIVEEALK